MEEAGKALGQPANFWLEQHSTRENIFNLSQSLGLNEWVRQ
jgi:hypothetical protein